MSINLNIPEPEFQKMVSVAIDKLPPRFMAEVKNVAFLVRDNPTAVQSTKLKLRSNSLLLGLYEGVPLVKRGGQTPTLPDVITIFRIPLLKISSSLEDLQLRINNTVWHEVAHYFGLDHDRINQLEGKN